MNAFSKITSAAFALALALTFGCSGDGGGDSIGSFNGDSNPSSDKTGCIVEELAIKANTLDDIRASCGNATRGEILAQLPDLIGTCSKTDLDFDKPLKTIMEECNANEIPVSSSSNSLSSSSVGNTAADGTWTMGTLTLELNGSEYILKNSGANWSKGTFSTNAVSGGGVATLGIAQTHNWSGGTWVSAPSSNENASVTLTGNTMVISGGLGSIGTYVNGTWTKTDRGSGSCTYQGETVKIGNQTWMAENLNCNIEGSKCYDNDPANCDKYGRLYDWAMAMNLPSICNSTTCASQISAKHRGICPSGWHIPTNDEWDVLYKFVDNSYVVEDGYSLTAGKDLKAKSGWNEGANGEDTYGFAALPGGEVYPISNFNLVGNFGFWWSASENAAADAYYRDMNYYGELAFWGIDPKTYLFSIRCVQD